MVLHSERFAPSPPQCGQSGRQPAAEGGQFYPRGRNRIDTVGRVREAGYEAKGSP